MSLGTPYASPLYAPLAHWLRQLPGRPDEAALAALAEQTPVHTANGLPVRFVPPQDDGLGYERRISEKGEVETRPDNWHDFFNALVWLAFPRSKAAVSGSHMRAMGADGSPRGMARDALTHFDECGLVVLSSQPELLDLLRGFQWRELFVTHRADVKAHLRFIIFGHATYESLLQPFRGLTAKAILLDATATQISQSFDALLPELDVRLATLLNSGTYARPRDFQPVPLLGIPGVIPDNEDPAYYDDTWQFRPGRRGQHAGGEAEKTAKIQIIYSE